jgi:hypothetical protein
MIETKGLVSSPTEALTSARGGWGNLPDGTLCSDTQPEIQDSPPPQNPFFTQRCFEPTLAKRIRICTSIQIESDASVSLSR